MSVSEQKVEVGEKMEKTSVVLMDVAGTSSSICFVKEKLFPFVVEKAESFLSDNWDKPDVTEVIKLFKESNADIPKEGEKEEVLKSLVSAVKDFTEKNSDNEGFKKLQGLVYESGYASGDLKGHVYADVAETLPKWASCRKVCVYSTGSVAAQKLLFAHSTEGDLSAHITDYFDQAVGNKTEEASYKAIADKLKCKTEEIVFLTDSHLEAKAATDAGVLCVLVARDGNEAIPDEESKKYTVIKSFVDLSFEPSSKRKNDEEADEAPPAKLAKTETDGKVEDKKEEAVAVAEEKMEVDSTDDTKTEETETVKPEEPEKTEKTEKKDVEKSVEVTEAMETDKPETKTETTEESKTIEKEDKPVETAMETAVKEDTKEEAKETVKEETKETVKEEAVKEETKEAAKEETKETVKEATKESPAMEVEAEVAKETATVEAKEVATESKKETVTEVAKETSPEPKKETKEPAKEAVTEPAKEAVTEPAKEAVTEATKEAEPTKEAEATKEAEPAKEAEPTKEPEVTKETVTEAAKVETKETEKAEEKTESEVTEEKTETEKESKEGEKEEAKSDEPKEEEAKASDKAENGTSDAKDEVVKNGSSSEEKENKSDLANGTHVENGTTKDKETDADIKVKKIESESAEPENVSLEV